VVVPVDSPALHVPLARIAKRYGLPVVHHVSPQFWAWAPWRAAAYRRAVDRTLSILPFEPAWFARRGIPVAHVGHPLLDQLAALPPAPRRPAGEPPPRVLALLPGSRVSVIERNLPWMLGAASRARSAVAGLEAVVVHGGREHEQRLRAITSASGAAGFARVECGDLHASLARAGAALTVSGTVLLDLVHQRLPTVVVYRVGRRRDVWLYRHLLCAPYFASVNLVLGREALPEFCFEGEGPSGAIQAALVRCFLDPRWVRSTRDALELCASRLGPPGASRRAARHVLDVALPSP
jgi:lipid-A-disaccharide synthase